LAATVDDRLAGRAEGGAQLLYDAASALGIRSDLIRPERRLDLCGGKELAGTLEEELQRANSVG
jgi:hypothetical protein